MIRFEHVSKRYVKDGAAVRALDDVTLEVPRGALALVQGPSGSGKTTLINLAAGLARPSAGQIEVAGEVLGRLSARGLSGLRARRIALVFQMFHLVPYLSALENVLLPTLASRSDAPEDRAARLLDVLGLTPRAGHYPSEMSAGERERCALARALMNQPEVILADEPTGNLDEESAGLVLDQLDAAHRAGATVLLVSHQHLDRIHADLEFHLKDGRLQA